MFPIHIDSFFTRANVFNVIDLFGSPLATHSGHHWLHSWVTTDYTLRSPLATHLYRHLIDALDKVLNLKKEVSGRLVSHDLVNHFRGGGVADNCKSFCEGRIIIPHDRVVQVEIASTQSSFVPFFAPLSKAPLGSRVVLNGLSLSRVNVSVSRLLQ